MLESLYVRDLNMCSPFVGVIGVSSLAKNGLTNWANLVKAGFVGRGSHGPKPVGSEPDVTEEPDRTVQDWKNEKSRTDLEKDRAILKPPTEKNGWE